MGTTLSQIRTSLPGLENWLSKVFTVMGGFIAGAGVLILYVGFVIIPLRLRGTGLVMVMSGALTVALMSITNFAINSDFKWALLFPVAMWMSGVFFYFKKV